MVLFSRYFAPSLPPSVSVSVSSLALPTTSVRLRLCVHVFVRYAVLSFALQMRNPLRPQSDTPENDADGEHARFTVKSAACAARTARYIGSARRMNHGTRQQP